MNTTMNKKLIPFLCMLLVLVSCSKSNPVVLEPDQQDQPKNSETDIVQSVSFNIPRFTVVDEVITKTEFNSDATAITWSANDTVGIYPNTGSQVFFVIDNGAGSTSAHFDGGGWEFKLSSVYYSYYPFIGNIYLRRDYIPVSYLGQKQIGTTSTSHIGPFDFMYTGATSSSSGALNFNYNRLGAVLYVRANLPAGTYTKLAITAPSEAFTTKGYFSLVASNPSIIPTEHSNQITIDLEGITLTQQSEFLVYLMIAPVNLNGVEITVSVLNDQRKEYQCKKTPSKAYTAGNKYGLNCSSFTEVPQSMGLIIDDWGDGGEIGGDAE